MSANKLSNNDMSIAILISETFNKVMLTNNDLNFVVLTTVFQRLDVTSQQVAL